MKITFSQLPEYDWWANGTPAHKDNWAMTVGKVPNQDIVKREYYQCLKTLQKHTVLHMYPFPEELDLHKQYRHDAIFTRDSFISNQKGDIVLSNFAEPQRKEESYAMGKFLINSGFRVHYLSDNAYAEGGEFYYIMQDNIAFAGICRNNKKGIIETAKKLGIKKVFIIESKSMHLDTVFTAIIDKHGHLAGALACLRLIQNRAALKKFMKSLHLPLFDIDIRDSIAPTGEGDITVNCLPVPGKLIGGGIFATPGVEEKLKKLGISHIISPVTQFKFSGGGIHCLTNELEY